MVPSHCIEPTYQQAKVTHSRQNPPAADQINNARSKKTVISRSGIFWPHTTKSGQLNEHKQLMTSKIHATDLSS